MLALKINNSCFSFSYKIECISFEDICCSVEEAWDEVVVNYDLQMLGLTEGMANDQVLWWFAALKIAC